MVIGGRKMNNRKSTRSLIILIIIVAVVMLTTLGIVLAENYNLVKSDNDSKQINNYEQNKDDEVTEVVDEKEEEQKPESVNALLVGFDKSSALTDVVMVARLDTETNKVKLLSLPRDLFIDFRKENFNKIKQDNKLRIKYCKLTEVYSNAGSDKDALLVLRDVIQEMTNINIDHTVAVNIDGFREIVDSIGGVEFYVPKRMKYYDPYQHLRINLHEGLQLLDGDKAEQLVRNRKYFGEVAPDIQRIKVQQDFLIAMTNKILSIRDFNQISQLASATYDLVDTDFGYLVVSKYVDYLYNLNLDELLSSDNMYVIPSYGEKIDGKWYEKYKDEEVQEIVDKLLTTNSNIDESN
jgi:LCP family protein required for cell wall assembly